MWFIMLTPDWYNTEFSAWCPLTVQKISIGFVTLSNRHHPKLRVLRM